MIRWVIKQQPRHVWNYDDFYFFIGRVGYMFEISDDCVNLFKYTSKIREPVFVKQFVTGPQNSEKLRHCLWGMYRVYHDV